MKTALHKGSFIVVLGLALHQPCAWADSSPQQAELENTLAQAIATYDPNLTTSASTDYENNLSIDQSVDLPSNNDYAIGAQLQVNSSTGSIVQDGDDDVAGIFQVQGANNSASITQTGNANYASVMQVGYSNAATISQQNDNNTLILNQQNGNNSANVTQLGNSNVTVNQTGNDVANLTFQVTTSTPVTYTYTQSPGSSWSAHITN